MTTAEKQELATIVAQAAATAAIAAIEAMGMGQMGQMEAQREEEPAASIRKAARTANREAAEHARAVLRLRSASEEERAAAEDTARRAVAPEPLPDDADEAAAQEIADMRLELEMGVAFAPDEEKRAGMRKLLEMVDNGLADKARALGLRFGLFRPETLAELPAHGPAAEATPEQRARQEAFKMERIEREIGNGLPRGEVLEIGNTSMVGGWGKQLAPGASQRIAERRAE